MSPTPQTSTGGKRTHWRQCKSFDACRRWSRRHSGSITSTQRAFRTDDFSRFVSMVLRVHVRRLGPPGASDVTVDECPSSVAETEYSHLTETIVRAAQRENWDLRDARRSVQQIRQMLFDADSGLMRVAGLSGLEFVDVDDESDPSHEMLWRASEIGSLLPDIPSSHRSSAIDEELQELLDASDIGLIVTTSGECRLILR